MDTHKVAKWLEVALAQRTREAKSMELKYGKEVAAGIYHEVNVLEIMIAKLKATEINTPLEKFIEDDQKKKGPK